MAESGKRFVIFWDFTTGATRYRWRLHGENGETLVFSQGRYANKLECESAIEELARKERSGVQVVDLTAPRSQKTR